MQTQALELTGIQQRKASQLQGFIEHAQRQVDRVSWRLLDGEKIPHQEKVFSIFEPHIRWIVKGKAGGLAGAGHVGGGDRGPA